MSDQIKQKQANPKTGKVEDVLKQYLKKVYYDKDLNTSSIEKLYQVAKNNLPDELKVIKKQLTKSLAREFIEKQGAYQRSKVFKPPKEFSSIIAPRVGSNLQTDLMFFKYPFKVKSLGKDANVLNVVDIHSRRAWAIPQKDKKAETIAANFEKILKTINEDQQEIQGIKGNVVRNLNSDLGKEFKNSVFKELLEKYGVNHYMSDKEDFAKNAIVERFNRTLRRHMTVDKEKRSGMQFEVKDISRYIKNYNNDLHSTIKAKPMDVYKGLDKNHQKYKFVKYDFKVGDIVRTLIKKSLFEKGKYEYSKKRFKIVKIDDYKNYDAPVGPDFKVQGKGKKLPELGKYKLKNVKTGEKLKRQYQGYELQISNLTDEADDYDIVIAEKNQNAEANEKRKAQMDAALAKDLGAVSVTGEKENDDSIIKQIEAPKLLNLKVKDKIEVFWTDSGVMWEKRLKEKKPKGKFYKASILKILREDNPDKIMYYVEFPDDVAKKKQDNRYKLNLTRSSESDFIRKGTGWKKM